MPTHTSCCINCGIDVAEQGLHRTCCYAEISDQKDNERRCCRKERPHSSHAHAQLVRPTFSGSDQANLIRSSVARIQDQHNNLLSQVRERGQHIAVLTQTSEYLRHGSLATPEPVETLGNFLDAVSQFAEEVSEALSFVVP